VTLAIPCNLNIRHVRLGNAFTVARLTQAEVQWCRLQHSWRAYCAFHMFSMRCMALLCDRPLMCRRCVSIGCDAEQSC